MSADKLRAFPLFNAASIFDFVVCFIVVGLRVGQSRPCFVLLANPARCDFFPLSVFKSIKTKHFIAVLVRLIMCAAVAKGFESAKFVYCVAVVAKLQSVNITVCS